MPVAGRARAALDRRVRRDRVRAGVALVGVVERHGHPGLRAGRGRVGDADRAAVPQAGAEVGLEPGLAPMLEIQVADCGSTGSPDTSACQKESAGVIGQDGASGTDRP